jgi:DNA-binding Lrp family transcriptional regulator
MEDKKGPQSGSYTQIPNVFFDTCDLPESAQILYLRLYRHIAYKDDHKFVGSIRKLSTLVRLSKSTVDRMLKRLEESRLIRIGYELSQDLDSKVMAITINPQELWILNKQHYEESTVPNWDKVMPDAKVLSQIGTLCPETGQSVFKTGQDDVNLGQSVPDASSNSGQESISTGNQLNESKKERLIHSFALSSDSLDKVREYAEEYKVDVSYCQGRAQEIYQQYALSDDDFYGYLIEAYQRSKDMADVFVQLMLMLGRNFEKREQQ